MALMSTLKKAVSRFVKDETGLVTAEAVIAMPVLVWWYVGSFVFFDSYQARNTNLKAAYTIADMISRETGTVDAAYLEGLDDIFAYLTSASGSKPDIRVTLVRCTLSCNHNDNNRGLAMDWSYGTDQTLALTESDLSKYEDEIPVIPLGERIILLETYIEYTPAWDVGILNPTEFTRVIATRPRFVPQIPFEATSG